MIRALFLLAALLCAAAVPAQGSQGWNPDVIYVPTPQEVVEDMLRLADVKKGDVLYDLGSGDGRIADHRGEEVRRPRDRHRHRSGAHRGGEPRTRRRPASPSWSSSARKTCSRPISGTPRS